MIELRFVTGYYYDCNAVSWQTKHSCIKFQGVNGNATILQTPFLSFAKYL